MPARFFLPMLPEPGDTAVDGELAHHLATVLRARPGAELRVGDGRGGTADAHVVAVERRRVHLRIARVHRTPPPTRRVHVAFAPPRLARAEWLFEHGTEVGVDVFWPLWTARTRPQGERLDRWQRIVRAAAGQCDRDWLPEVQPARELGAFLGGPLPPARFVGAPGAPPLGEAADAAGDVVVLVGPEGGFADGERDAVAAAGFVPAGLGPHVLRTETAALVAAALLQRALLQRARLPNRA